MHILPLVVFVIVVGCSASPEGDRWPEPHADAPLVPTRVVEDRSGRYEGSYVCPQGKTAMVLTIEQQTDGRTHAVFAFGAHPDNPGVPAGSFRMHGSIDEEGRLRLEASEADWIERPDGYVTVDLRGEFDGEKLFGDVIEVECSTFSVVRASD